MTKEKEKKDIYIPEKYDLKMYELVDLLKKEKNLCDLCYEAYKLGFMRGQQTND